LYEAAGFTCASTSTGTRYGDTDLFNKFDAIALHTDEPVHFIQVKSNGTGGDLNAFFEWCGQNLPAHSATAHFAVRYDRDGWKLYEQDGRGYAVAVDERDADCGIGERVTDYLTEGTTNE
jgi:hypothetical protein